MADGETTSSSDDNWFEPEDLTISTTDLLKQTQKIQQISQQIPPQISQQKQIQVTIINDL